MALSNRPLSLICEGRCNPTITHVDSFRRQFTKENSETVGTPMLWAMQHRLVYTPHVMMRLNRAACESCGAERQYGNEIAW